MTYEEALKYIHSVNWRGSKLGLDRTRELLANMGNPEKELRFIHIAGTNGKGSVAAMLASVLKEAGYKTGLYTSPYIISFNERMQVNGSPIKNSELAELTSYISQFAGVMSDPPTEFELITALAFEFFYRKGCDIVVLETGMGGELDSTNVIGTPELAIITAIGYDHTRELGSTMREIASAKAGIIKPNGTVLFFGENADAEKVIRQRCASVRSELFMPDFNELKIDEIRIDRLSFDFKKYSGISIPLTGVYQFKNAAMTLSAIDLLIYKGRNISAEAVKKGLAEVKWRGRFEILAREPLFISDGGHNPQGVTAAVDSFKTHFPNQKGIFLIGIMADKDIDAMTAPIAKVASCFITVTPDNPRAMPAEELKRRLSKYDLPVTACSSVLEGVKKAFSVAGKGGIVFSIGSLFLYREVLASVNCVNNSDSIPLPRGGS